MERILTGGQIVELPYEGMTFNLKSSTAGIRLHFDGGEIEELNSGEGVTSADRFQSLRVENLSASSNTIEFTVNDKQFYSNRQAGNVNVNTSDSQEAEAVQSKTDTQTHTYAAQAGRKSFYIKNLSTSAGTIWVGATAVNTGYPLSAGEGMPILDHDGAIDVYSEGINSFAALDLYEA